MIRTIPLGKLMPSPRNVRRTVDREADLQLKSDIEARGLLQNLVVAPSKKPRGRFTVEAGGRRFRALVSLLEDGKLPANHEVSCLVVEDGPEAVREASLAENVQRLAMNPADECLAFQQLIEHGADIDGIARRFGLTARFVEGRLRLAALAPVVFQALGAGDISLDVAKAYAATPDHERQAFVFEQVGRSYMASHPDSIRRMMTQATVPASDRRARFVGEDSYVAAGGRVERDLFSDEAGVRWLDVDLLERLAVEKMEAQAAEITSACGLAFVRPTLERWVGYAMTVGLQQVELEQAPLADEEKAELDALDTELEMLVAQLEHELEDDQGRLAAENRVREIGARMEAIRDKPPLIPEDLKSRIGTFLLLGDAGEVRLDSSYYVEASDNPAEPSPSSGAQDGGSDCGCHEAAGKPRTLSQALADELAIQRRDILAVHVAADPALALDLATFLMVDREAANAWEKSGSSLMASAPSDPVLGFRTPDAAATRAWEEALKALDRSWLEASTKADRFDAFRALPDAARAAWLGHAVARTLEASLNLPGGRACAFHDHLGCLLGIAVDTWWRPTGANYFDRISKATILEALEEVGGPELARRYAKAKKADLAESAERIFAGDVIAEAEVKGRAIAWVPEAMRFAARTAEPAAENPPLEDPQAQASPPSPMDPRMPEDSGLRGPGAPDAQDDAVPEGGQERGDGGAGSSQGGQEALDEAA